MESPSSTDRPQHSTAEDTAHIERILFEIKKMIVGQDRAMERIVVSMLAGGHCLLESVPGLAKTLSAETLARTVGGTYHRVQFTPDLLPADIVGTRIYRSSSEVFDIELGPVFANFVLADEINRAPAKVQSALLEAMAEHQVTIGVTHELPSPFLVLATQNPIENEGVYPLPEAQRDRFLMKILLTYPTPLEELEIVNRMGVKPPVTTQIIDPAELVRLQESATQVYADRSVIEYAINLVLATRTPQNYGLADLVPYLEFGASPRASLGLVRAGRAMALVRGRSYVVPQDIFDVAPEILRHRLVVTYDALAEGVDAEAILVRILSSVPAPMVAPAQQSPGDAWYGTGTDSRAWSA